MLSLRCIRNEFLHNHVEHCAGGKGQHEGHDSRYGRCKSKHQSPTDRLHNSAERTNEEGLSLAVPRRPKRHGDYCTLRDILDGYSKGKGQGCGHVEIGLKGAGYCNTHGHSLREIVDGHGQSQLCGTGKAAAGALGLTANVDVRCHVVYEKQERKAAKKARKGWADRTHLH